MMMRSALLAGCLALQLALGGCVVAASAPSFADAVAPAPEEGMALVYVFRDRAEPTAWGATIFFDDDKVTTLKEDGFTWAYLAPGEHRIRAEWFWLSSQEDSFITLDVAAGQTYHLELLGVVNVTGMAGNMMYMEIGSGMNLLDARTAVERMTRCCRFQQPAAPRYPVSP
jgi:hypothetical protein